MSPESTHLVATLAIALLVLTSVAVWDIAGDRARLATAADERDAVADQVTVRQAPADYDGDGLSDASDVCPTRPETTNGFQDSDGCPDVVATTGAS